MRNDQLMMECLEDIYYFIENELKKIGKNKSVHSLILEKMAQDLLCQCRIFEEISYAARLVVEHLMEIQLKGGMVAVEAEYFSQNHTVVNHVHIEEFGIVKIFLGQLEISWRDNNYQYYLYPDKVEMRAVDEKSAIKLFFSHAFYSQIVERFPEIRNSSNVVYIHPELKKWLGMKN